MEPLGAVAVHWLMGVMAAAVVPCHEQSRPVVDLSWQDLRLEAYILTVDRPQNIDVRLV